MRSGNEPLAERAGERPEERTAPPSTPMTSTRIFRRLDTEWAASWARRPVPAHWDQPALAHAGTLAGVLDTARHDRATADRVLDALACHAPNDQAARRVILQLMLPGFWNVTRSVAHRFDNNEEADAAVLAAACQVIARPPTHRPSALAANIVLDTLRVALSGATRTTRPTRNDTVPPDTSESGPGYTNPELRADTDGAATDPGYADAELSADLQRAVTTGRITARQARLVLAQLADRPLTDIATQENVHPGRLRQLRHDARQPLAAALLAA